MAKRAKCLPTYDGSALEGNGWHSRCARSRGDAARVLIAALALIVGSGSLAATDADPPVTQEYQLKAAFLFNFTRFVVWPPERFPAPDSELVIGVYGSNPFSTALADAVAGREVNGHPVVFRVVEDLEAARTAHVLFLSATEDPRTADVLNALSGISVLTVVETDAGSDAGAVIRFRLVSDQLRFEINVDAARQAALQISAQLQQLATRIVRAP